jgi:hypothetical protein
MPDQEQRFYTCVDIMLQNLRSLNEGKEEDMFLSARGAAQNVGCIFARDLTEWRHDVRE